MEVDPPDAQPKKSWIEVAVEGARPSAKAKTAPPKASEVQAPKAEPKGKATPVPKAGDDPAPRPEPKETQKNDPKTEVKKGKGSGDDAPGNSRKPRKERKSRWDPEAPTKESTKREASKRPDDVDSRPGGKWR